VLVGPNFLDIYGITWKILIERMEKNKIVVLLKCCASFEATLVASSCQISIRVGDYVICNNEYFDFTTLFSNSTQKIGSFDLNDFPPVFTIGMNGFYPIPV
tara:strand:- start:1201 stop:1503 length:303 start_codon:yes stop_codon:yes gene_type:complete